MRGRPLTPAQAHVNHEDDRLTVTSLRPIDPGEEVLNYYGPLANSELLRRYGYVTERHARHDVVELPWDAVVAAAAAQLGLSAAVVKEAVRGPPPPPTRANPC